MESRKMMKSYLHVLIIGLSIFAIVCSTAQAADWPNYRGPNYDGTSTETGWSSSWPEEGPKVLWKYSLGTGFASMAVSNGKVYAMGNNDDKDFLYCLDAATGTEIWKKSYPCPLYAKMHEGGPCATPTVQGDAVYTLSKDGDAIRFKAATGEVVWHKKLNKELGMKHPSWHFSGSPLIAGDLVIYNAGTYGIALNKTDGSTVWQNGKSACGYTTGVPCSIGGQKNIVMAVCKELVGLNPTTGKVMWKFPWKTSYDINAADAIISGDKVFISSGYNKGCALVKISGGDATKVWQNKNMRNQINCSVLWEGHIYGFDGQVGGSGKLTCLDLATGEQKWSQDGMGTGSLMLADGKLIILGEKGKLVIAEASSEGYKELASAKILSGKCWTTPVLANGRIYARNAEGQLVCVDVSS
ncbi:MAG: PQQ-binding-like beta-propeller repeat protein [Planctomycetota bacterium]|jgi:outer membrane protein assembly factor BamB